jgi:hypothetical protein
MRINRRLCSLPGKLKAGKVTRARESRIKKLNAARRSIFAGGVGYIPGR